MNKKFSTLMASLLLVGSAFSTATAQKIADAANDGKYYKIKCTAAWTVADSWSAVNTDFFFAGSADKQTQVSSEAGFYLVSKEGDKYSFKTSGNKELSVGGFNAFTDVYYDHTVLNGANGSLLYAKRISGATPEDIFIGTSADGSLKLVSTLGVSENYPGQWGWAVETVATNLQAVKGYNATINSGSTYRILSANGNGTPTQVDGTMYVAAYDKETDTYSFTKNLNGSKLTVDGEYDFKFIKVGDDVVMALPSGRGYVAVENNGFKLVDDMANATVLAFAATNTKIPVQVSTLNYYEKDGFSVEIYYDAKDGEIHSGHLVSGISGNPFEGHLTTMKFTYNSNGTGEFAPSDRTDNEFWLKNEAGNYIVAIPYNVQTANPSESLYKFITVSENDLKRNLVRAHNGNLQGEQEYFGKFRASVDEAAFEADKTSLDEITWLQVNVKKTWESTASYVYATIGRADINGTATLVAAQENAGNAPTKLFPVYISLNTGQVVEWADLLTSKFFEIEKVTTVAGKAKADNGYLVAYDLTGTDDHYVYVKSYGNVLEGQWALTAVDATTKDSKAKKYIFTNRENTQISFTFEDAQKLYVVPGKANTYKYENEVYVIKPVDTKDSDGYARLDVNKELNQTWNVAFSSNVFAGKAYLTENHEDGANYHVVGLDTDVDNALQFSVKKYDGKFTITEMKDGTYRNVYTPSDSIYVVSELGYYNTKTKRYAVKADTLKVVSYSFVNQWNEPLVYSAEGTLDYGYRSLVTYEEGNNTLKYANASLAKAHADADKFAVRFDGECYNLRPLDHWNREMVEPSQVGATMHQIFINDDDDDSEASDLLKVYAGDAKKGILTLTDMYERTENDLFVIEQSSKAIYRSLEGANANGLDTISIYRDENNKSLLYEKAVTLTADNNKVVNFLGMENIADFTEMAPAMLVDTAYVRNETYKPQYLLVVNPTIVPAGKWCDVHQTADCEHAVPTKGLVSGRFLVSLADTAAVWADANKHKAGNPYLNSENLPKLGFVQATHYNDTLAITREKPTAADSLYLGNNDFNVAKFAFKYVDTESKSFLIETKGGFLKWMNGYVVVVPNEKDADIFNLNENEDRNPTANEAIAAEGVQVIAGKGVVTVQGAAGKVITVANILGQTIANQVAASDNVTIAAPAGVVVVAVDGEATKVVVK